MNVDRLKGIPIEFIKTAVLCYRLKNSAPVSKILEMQRPAIWKRIHTLEELLGFKLFQTTQRSGEIAPTPEGLDFLRYASSFMPAYDALLARYLSENNLEDHHCRVAVAATASAYVPAAAAELLADGARCRLIETDTGSVIAAVSEGRAELGFVEICGENQAVLEGLAYSRRLQVSLLHQTPCHVTLRKDHPALAALPRRRMPEGVLAPYVQACYDDPQLPDGVRISNLSSMLEDRAVVTQRATMADLLQNSDAYCIGTGYLPRNLQDSLLTLPTTPKRKMIVLVLRRAGSTPGFEASKLVELVKDKLDQMLLRRNIAAGIDEDSGD